MLTVIQELMDDAREEGIKEGIRIWMQEGEIKATVETGKALGATQETIINLLVERLGRPVDEITTTVRRLW